MSQRKTRKRPLTSLLPDGSRLSESLWLLMRTVSVSTTPPVSAARILLLPTEHRGRASSTESALSELKEQTLLAPRNSSSLGGWVVSRKYFRIIRGGFYQCQVCIWRMYAPRQSENSLNSLWVLCVLKGFCITECFVWHMLISLENDQLVNKTLCCLTST